MCHIFLIWLGFSGHSLLIFCDSHRVGDGQKAFFDTVVEYSTCKYLGNYLNGKHDRHTTWYLSLKEKKSYIKLLLNGW